MKTFNKRYLFIAIGVSAGAIAGFFYWRFFGCDGSCMITSSPFNSSVYGAVVGGLLFSILKTKKKEAE